MNLFRRFGLLLVPLAVAAVGARPALASADPRLLAPRAGAELAAGSLAAIAWQDPPSGTEEWEAFLSLDGGRTYPLRITPHLDLGIRRFTFQVPPFPTRDARMLLRFGDERREIEAEAEQRFAIVAGKASWPPDLGIALSRGERPRPRDPGVAVWVEGARDGSSLREVAVAQEDCSFLSVETARLPWMPLAGPLRLRAGQCAPYASTPAFLTSVPARLEAAPAASPPVRPSVRVLTGRLNE